jgi:WhiB family transcriptional regulator, redox-sensing transcriptional regulator
MTGDWHDLANCLGMDPNVFVFQEPRHGVNDRKVQRAKAICADCKVATECLAEALTFEAIGVWGQTTEEERRSLKRRRRRAATRAASRPVPAPDQSAAARDAAWLASELAAIA